MIAQHDRADEYTALSDRMGYLMVLRVAMAVMTVAWTVLRPEALAQPFGQLLAITGGYVALAAIAEVVRRRAGRRGFAVMSTLLIVDGLYLAYAMYVTGATQSPIRFLIYLHLVAVSLLASYRTGLKIALWHSLLLFVVLYAQAAALLPAVDVIAGQGIDFDRMPVLNVTSFWLFALATSIFSAMNERELRQRRADLEALVEVGARLDDVSDPVLQARVVLDGLAARFGFARGLVIGAADGNLIVLASRGAAEWSGTVQADDVIRRAWERRELLPVRKVSQEGNPLLSATLPDARNLLVSPMFADGRPVGAIVVEHRSRTVFGIERRIASVLRQFSAVAALNLRNAVLLRHVQDLAERDSLTGAANRRMFQLTLERTLETREAVEGDERTTAVLFIDLDDFKVINDTLGHAAGDALLVAVTERITGLVRQGDLVARLGGDEFAILTDDEPNLPRSRAMAERLVRDLRVPYVIGEHTTTVSASIGIATAGDAGSDALELVRNADVAMYMAKANGKAGFAVFDPGMHASIRARHELGAELQHAVDLGQLRLVYQPIVSLESGRISGLEALVRWEHPDRGLVAPGEFIEIAEENGAILPIGRWVLRQACEHAVAWQNAGVTPAGLFMCVNISARELQQPGFVGAVEESLAWAGLEPSRLILEITETALIKATSPTVVTLDSLRAIGVRVVIDDFGTGYFSLSHLRQFPVDALKIASEFVQVADDDSRSAALAGAIVALGESLDIATVAEGIETKQQAERMRTLGCTYGQGYFFARPITATAIEAGIEGLASNRRWEGASRHGGTRRRSSVRSVIGDQPSAA
ncbi:MAG: putative bifunctional diguanylate cyclase/phosphodiesterase [Candidatus Limnocylindria bacterium]